MSKSMYSLILIDEIVRAVDKLAHQKGTNRSNLINQILAEHLAIKTPEKRISEILKETVKALGSDLQAGGEAANPLVVKAALGYKYNPTVRYSIELEADARAYTGLFKASTRTQNKALLMRLNMFHELWMQIESTCLPSLRKQKPVSTAKNGRFSRTFLIENRDGDADAAAIGSAIADYLRLFDDAANLFFETASGVDIGTYKDMLAKYERYLEAAQIVI